LGREPFKAAIGGGERFAQREADTVSGAPHCDLQEQRLIGSRRMRRELFQRLQGRISFLADGWVLSEAVAGRVVDRDKRPRDCNQRLIGNGRRGGIGLVQDGTIELLRLATEFFCALNQH
jgi:hypothetical protein